MEIANLLAQIWGIALVIIPLSLLINPDQIKELFSAGEKEVSAFKCWAVVFIVGLGTVLQNNIWTKDWKALVTIFGWIAILRALFGLFMPKKSAEMCSKMKNQEWLSYAVLVVLFVGLVTTYFGFTGK